MKNIIIFQDKTVLIRHNFLLTLKNFNIYKIITKL